MKLPEKKEMVAEYEAEMKLEGNVRSMLDAVDFKYVNDLSQFLEEQSLDNSSQLQQLMADAHADFATSRTKNHYKSRYQKIKIRFVHILGYFMNLCIFRVVIQRGSTINI